MSEAPKATYIEDEFLFHWESRGIELVIERFREKDGSLFADVQPRSSTGAGFLPPDKLNLGSARSIKMYANTLAERGLFSGDEWFDMLSQASALSVRRYREGEPSVVLADVEWRGKSKYVLAPYIDRHGTTIIFGDGGISKSIHALAFGVSVAVGTTIIPDTVVREVGPVIYLDWEADDETHAERLEAICAGHGIEAPKNLHYMRRVGSLGASVREFRSEIAARQAVFVVVDSIGAACGGDPEQAASVIAAMNAIRAFGVPTLAIHHIAKDAKDKTKPFGSVYAPNLARRTWRLDKEQSPGEDTIYVRAINFKVNNGKVNTSVGHSVRFYEDELENLEQVCFGTGPIGRMPRSGNAGLKWPIAQELRSGPLTVRELALALDASEDTCRKTLRRWPDWFIEVGGKWALIETDNQLLSDRTLSEPTGQDTPSPYGGSLSREIPDEMGDPQPW